MAGIFETVQNLASIKAAYCSKQPQKIKNSKHFFCWFYLKEKQAAAEAETLKQHVPERESLFKAEESLCPAKSGALWCPLYGLTTLMMMLSVSLHFIVSRKIVSKVRQHVQRYFLVSSTFSASCPPTPPQHPHASSLGAYLTALTCYHTVMDAWWFVSTDLAGNYFDLSWREKNIYQHFAVTSYRTTPLPWMHADTWKSTVLQKYLIHLLWILTSTQHNESCMKEAILSLHWATCQPL